MHKRVKRVQASIAKPSVWNLRNKLRGLGRKVPCSVLYRPQGLKQQKLRGDKRRSPRDHTEKATWGTITNSHEINQTETGEDCLEILDSNLKQATAESDCHEPPKTRKLYTSYMCHHLPMLNSSPKVPPVVRVECSNVSHNHPAI